MVALCLMFGNFPSPVISPLPFPVEILLLQFFLIIEFNLHGSLEGIEPTLCLSRHTKCASLLDIPIVFGASAKIQDLIPDSLSAIATSFATALSILSYRLHIVSVVGFEPTS